MIKDLIGAERDTSSVAYERGRNPARFAKLIVLVWLITVLPGFVHFTVTPHIPSRDLIWTQAASWMRLAMLGATVLYASNVLLAPNSRTSQRARKSVRIGLLVLGCVLLASVVTERVTFTHFLYITTLALLVSAIASTAPSLKDLRMIGVLGVMTSVVSLIMALTTPQNAFVTELDGTYYISGKFFGSLPALAGPFDSSAALGIFIALCMPFVSLFPSRRMRVLAWLVCAPALLLSGSRVSLLVIGAIVLLTMFYFVIPLKFARSSLTLIATSSLAVAILFPFSLVIMGWSSSALSGRESIWSRHITAWKESPFFGLGFSWFRDGQELTNPSGFNPTHSHNLFLSSLIVGGLVLTSLVILLYWLLIRSSIELLREAERSSGDVAPIAFALGLLLIATTETAVFWSPMSTYIIHGLLVPVGILAVAGSVAPCHEIQEIAQVWKAEAR